MNYRPIGLLSGICIVASSCAEDRVEAPQVEVRDSSGIRIVQSLRPEEPQLAVSQEPLFRTGWAISDPQFQRIYLGFLRPDESVLVADVGANSLYVLDSDGDLVATIGRSGQGPGEFSRITSLVTMPGDSFLVSDGGNHRVTIFDGVEPVRDYRFQSFFPPALPIYDPIAYNPDGSFLLVPTAWPVSLVQRAEPGWLEAGLLRTRDFTAVDTIASMPFLMATGNANPIQHLGRYVAAGPHLVHTTTDVAQASWLGPDGAHTQIARWDTSPRALTDTDWDRYEAGFRDRNADRDAELVEQTIRQRRPDFGGTEPLFRNAVGDQLGGVWFVPHDVGTAGFESLFVERYEVLSPDGIHVGSITFPNPILVIDATEDRVLGVERNELDVQAVVVYALDRGASHVR